MSVTDFQILVRLPAAAAKGSNNNFGTGFTLGALSYATHPFYSRLVITDFHIITLF